MSETLQSANDSTSTDNEIDKLHSILDTSTLESGNLVEDTDTREVSTVGSSLIRAANRVNSALQKRSVDIAHGRALHEYRSRDYSEYIDHLNNTSLNGGSPEAQNYAKSELKLEHRHTDRQEKLQNAKTVLRDFGRRSIHKLAETGTISLGIGLMAGEAIGRTGRKASTSSLETAKSAGDTIKLNIELTKLLAKNSLERRIETGKKAISDQVNSGVKAYENGKVKVISTIESTKDTISAAKEALAYRKLERARLKEAALSRKYERHSRWFNYKRDARNRAEEFNTDIRHKTETIRQKQKSIRSAGRMALQTFKDHV